MKIGTFTQHSNGNISGSISTFGGNFENVNLVPTDRTAPSPKYTLETKGCDLGAAWEKISKDEKPYMSVQLKGPFLPQPIWAILIEDETSPGSYALLWNEPRKNKSQSAGSNQRPQEDYDSIPY